MSQPPRVDPGELRAMISTLERLIAEASRAVTTLKAAIASAEESSGSVRRERHAERPIPARATTASDPVRRIVIGRAPRPTPWSRKPAATPWSKRRTVQCAPPPDRPVRVSAAPSPATVPTTVLSSPYRQRAVFGPPVSAVLPQQAVFGAPVSEVVQPAVFSPPESVVAQQAVFGAPVSEVVQPAVFSPPESVVAQQAVFGPPVSEVPQQQPVFGPPVSAVPQQAAFGQSVPEVPQREAVIGPPVLEVPHQQGVSGSPDAATVRLQTDIGPGSEIARITRELATRHGLEVIGFDTSGVGVPTIHEIAAALDDLLAKYPIPLRGIEITGRSEGASTHSVRDRRAEAGRSDAPALWIVLDTAALTDAVPPEGIRQKKRGRRRRHQAADRSVQTAIAREFAGALDIAGGFRARQEAWRALMAESLRAGGRVDHGLLEPRQALVQAFTEVELAGDRAGELAKVLHGMLVKMARADSPNLSA
ncbi:hypothetical protein AB0B25_27900 [Nocardia sp. NPDC049190]|uniref:hypothetical protein n=1 Tax=Nocardia sp. NPDC049190 TaxID=3155650 RepID=UPI0033D5908C